jgi:hypothetical protein
MIASEIIAHAKDQTYSESGELDNTQLLKYANIVYKRILSKINKETNLNYYADDFTTDLVLGQAEYSLPKKYVNVENEKVPGCSNVIKVTLNYKHNGSDKFIKARPVDISTVTDLDNLNKNASQEDPVYVIYDNGIRVYPIPESNVVDGLIIHGNIDAWDMELADTPILDEKWHDLIALGMEYFIYKAWGKRDEAQASDIEFQNKLHECVVDHMGRHRDVVIVQTPNLEFLCP